MSYFVYTSPQHGKGVFASRPIAAGEVILAFSGPLLQRIQISKDDYHLQIGEDLYIGASGAADDYVNHSCDPNAGFCGGLQLVARRAIASGEEITWDYSTAIDEDDFPGFPCTCGSFHCRGMVRSFRHLSAEDQIRLKPWLLPYLMKKYFPEANQNAGSTNARSDT
jgi:hypothetical protein